MYKKAWLWTVVASAVLMLVSGCVRSDAGPTPSENVKTNEPVTLRVAVGDLYLDDAEFKQFVAEPVRKKFPYITVQEVAIQPNRETFQNMIASNDVPDIMVYAALLISDLTDLGLEYNMDDLIKKHRMDLERFEPRALQSVQTTSRHDYLIGIPFTMHFSALYYNKDIFDKFGVAYPKDGMTWEDATELAKKLTRNEDGAQYRGLEPDHVTRAGSQLSVPLVDPKTKKAALSTESWKTVFATLQKIYEIPGNSEMQITRSGIEAFTKGKKLAMLASLNWLAQLGQVNDLNWDVASYPVFKDHPATGTQLDAQVMMVMPGSQHKDEAMSVIETVVSDDVQLDMVRNGKVTTLKDPRLLQSFGQNLAYMKGKHIEGLFKNTPAAVYDTQYSGITNKAAQDVMRNVVGKGMDLNTALRNADDQINQQIEALTGK